MKKFISVLILLFLSFSQISAQETAALKAFRAGDYSAALELYDAALKLNDDPRYRAQLLDEKRRAKKCANLLYQANRCFNASDYVNAQIYYGKVLSYNSTDPLAKERNQFCLNKVNEVKLIEQEINSRDEELWNEAVQANTLQSYQKYLDSYEVGHAKYIPLAMARVNLFKGMQAYADSDYEEALDYLEEASLEIELTPEAEKALKECSLLLQSSEESEFAYSYILDNPNLTATLDFLQKYPGSRHVDQVRDIAAILYSAKNDFDSARFLARSEKVKKYVEVKYIEFQDKQLKKEEKTTVQEEMHETPSYSIGQDLGDCYVIWIGKGSRTLTTVMKEYIECFKSDISIPSGWRLPTASELSTIYKELKDHYPGIGAFCVKSLTSRRIECVIFGKDRPYQAPICKNYRYSLLLVQDVR